MGHEKPLSWVAVAFVAAALPVTFAMSLAAGAVSRAGLANNLAYVSTLVVTTALGVTILRHHRGHRVGWLLLLSGCVITMEALTAEYARWSASRPDALPGGRLVTVWDTVSWPLLFAPVVAIAWVFPDGRLVSPRWRGPAWFGAASFVATLLGGLLGDEHLDAPYGEMRALDLLPSTVTGTMQFAGLMGMIVTMVLALVCLVIRFRRSSGVERQQVKWLALAGIFIPVAIVVGTLDSDGPGLPTLITTVATLVLVPLAIGVAILRHGLYDIDRLISTTVLYAVMTLLLGGAFASIILLGGVVAGRGSPAITALATLVVTLAFRPLQSRLQRGVDRRFNRARYDALKAVDDFLEDLRAGRSEPEEVGGVLADALPDPSLQLFFWLPEPGSHADSSGHLVADLPEHPSGRTPVRRGDLLLATVLHDVVRRPQQILDELLVRAGLAIEVARLRVEVRRQLAAVEESRFRIVTAGQEERRRLERDLHDGAQQRLVSVGLDLRHLQLRVADEEVVAGLDQAVDSLASAIQELRDLANGVRPNALDAGLAAAFAGLAALTPLPIEVRATGQRFAPEVEAAAYFVASEGLANAVKHSSASHVVLTAQRSEDVLRVAVSDDGRGGAHATVGSGLHGLRDRVAALGGRLAVVSPPGDGTRLEMEIPCA